MRYKVEVKRKYIYVYPTPKRSIKNGLWVKVKDPLESCTPFMYTDLLKGKNRYDKPFNWLANKYFKIEKAWVKNESSKRFSSRKSTKKRTDN